MNAFTREVVPDNFFHKLTVKQVRRTAILSPDMSFRMTRKEWTLFESCCLCLWTRTQTGEETTVTSMVFRVFQNRTLQQRRVFPSQQLIECIIFLMIIMTRICGVTVGQETTWCCNNTKMPKFDSWSNGYKTQNGHLEKRFQAWVLQ